MVSSVSTILRRASTLLQCTMDGVNALGFRREYQQELGTGNVFLKFKIQVLFCQTFFGSQYIEYSVDCSICLIVGLASR